MLWPFILLTIIALAIVLYTERRDGSNAANATGARADGDRRNLLIGGVAKTFASIGFIAGALAADALETLIGQALFIALVWSFIGDVLLIFKGSRLAFMFGIGSFLMGHLGFAMVFRIRGIDATAFMIACAGFAIVAWVIWRWLSPHVRGAMRIAVGAYIAVITLMVACAVGSIVAVPAVLPLAAAMLFWVSDLTVARQRFVVRSFWNRAIGLPLYFAAQFLFIGLIG